MFYGEAENFVFARYFRVSQISLERCRLIRTVTQEGLMLLTQCSQYFLRHRAVTHCECKNKIVKVIDKSIDHRLILKGENQRTGLIVQLKLRKMKNEIHWLDKYPNEDILIYNYVDLFFLFLYERHYLYPECFSSRGESIVSLVIIET